ncbi:exo-beta 1,3 glucanase-like protein [Lojkania enalia]|uniref:Exo-beta 1,3 glucanase-like protein n=1 Tax=Lojkania enalia TaxID=147567 RepID=A0A9P4K8M7_9PLEO|nr:exo-beta 1,3 glucanase-like protein [Didymosphaeria enalia]
MRVSLLSCLFATGVYSAVLVYPDGSGLDAATPTPDQVCAQSIHAGPDNLQARADNPPYWLADIEHRGISPFHENSAGYKIWRNVKEYGAKGDGVTDDTAAINRAIYDGGRCKFWECQSTSISPAIVYFPPGTYLVKKRIEIYYLTSLHGNPANRAVIKPAIDFNGTMVVDSSPYSDITGGPGWLSTNLFMRQIRNIEVDMTAFPIDQQLRGIHWPASQATSLQNVKVRMVSNPNSQHEGIFVENGSGGWMVDIETVGGKIGLNIGNQQFTMRNIQVSDAIVGIFQIWNWGWMYQNINIKNCRTAFNMDGINSTTQDQLVGSVVIIDSSITDCGTFLSTSWTRDTKPIGAGQLILENIVLTNVPVAINGTTGTILAGGTKTIDAWGQGIKYSPAGPEKFQGEFKPAGRPRGLLNPKVNGGFWNKQKPQYEGVALDQFTSVRSAGATGDGETDDTNAVQDAIKDAIAKNKILFFDHGVYKVTNTIYIPPGARMVGEMFSTIMATGSTWKDKTNPVPVIQIGKPGENGSVEWSDMLITTQGPTPGAKIIEYNLDTKLGSGLWDVHTRIGGTKGSGLQVADCPIYSVKESCMAAHTNVHITKTGRGAYFENNWFWTADHDLDDWNSTRITVLTGRGLLVEASNVWLYANGVEHHGLYQYQFANAIDVFAGYIQTETPYWQPQPDAKAQHYPTSAALNDPDYTSFCPDGICDALGLRILNSQGVCIYAAGLYSFFINYDVSCSSPEAPNGERECQNRIFSIEGNSTVQVYSLNQVGAIQMVTIDDVDKAKYSDNLSVYSNTVGLFTYNP